MDVLTYRMLRTYDRLRTVRSIEGDLELERATSTGYQAIGSPITPGWYCEYLRDAETGEQYLQVLIAESDAWDTSVMTTCATVVIESRRHKVSVILPPKGAPRTWLLKAAPTGEPVA